MSCDNDVLFQNVVNDYFLCFFNEYKFEEVGIIIKNCCDCYFVWGMEDINLWENLKYYGNYSVVLMWMGELDQVISY